MELVTGDPAVTAVRTSYAIATELMADELSYSDRNDDRLSNGDRNDDGLSNSDRNDDE